MPGIQDAKRPALTSHLAARQNTVQQPQGMEKGGPSTDQRLGLTKDPFVIFFR